MNSPCLVPVLAFFLLALQFSAEIADAASEHVAVLLAEPENFTDAGSPYLVDRRASCLRQSAAKHLSVGQKLTINITDIDMAGGYEPWHGPQFSDIRAMRDVYPPRIDLAFTLTDADGDVIASGERRRRDVSYLMTTVSRIDADPLVYEKLLVREWLWREFNR
ncbi:MAG: DUF3016 domain-containing protein [Gammaproteobacteria bacterium]|nr:DUF3016 domain-containing protein [Gammaproteobacteria bacterium]